MNRPDQYMKQATACAAWLRAEGDDDGAALARQLAAHLRDRHAAQEDTRSSEVPSWARGDDFDANPTIRCWPSPGVVTLGEDGPVLAIDMWTTALDLGMAVVHLGDVVEWRRAREEGADAVARASLRESEPDYPTEVFRVKDPDALAPMVRAAGLSRDHYLEYGEYAQLEVRVHPDATITGRILRRDGADEVQPVTEAELAEERGDDEA